MKDRHCRYCKAPFEQPCEVLAHYKRDHFAEYYADLKAKRERRPRRAAVPHGYQLVPIARLREVVAAEKLAEAALGILSSERELAKIERRNRLAGLCELLGLDVQKMIAFFGDPSLLPEKKDEAEEAHHG